MESNWGVRAAGVRVGRVGCDIGRIVCFLLILFTLLPSTAATADEALPWLTARAQADGSYRSPGDGVATVFQETAETLQTLHAIGAAPAADTLAYLAADPYRGTEHLAHRIVARHAAGQGDLAEVAELLARQNPDGGFGELPGHLSTALDTAFALQALALTQPPTAIPVDRALSWLLQRQRPDGSWQDAPQASARYVTALASLALLPYRSTYDLEPALSAARPHLVATQDADSFELALSLLAFVPGSFDSTVYQPLVDILEQRRATDGSWEQDVYVTALALRALYAASHPNPSHPQQGGISGRIVDGQTGLPLAGVGLGLTGPTPHSAQTGSDGRFLFQPLDPGLYTLAIELAGYATLTASTTVHGGRQVDFGSIALSKSAQATTGTVLGSVTDAASGAPLAGVTVEVNGQLQAVTQADGRYQIANVPPGSLTLTAALSGYATVSGTGTLSAGGLAVFSPALTASAGGEPVAVLTGIVSDAQSGALLAGVSIEVGGASQAQAVTDADGSYRIEGLTPGPLTVLATLAGYDPVAAGAQIHEGQTLGFSPRLYPQGGTPPGVNTAGLRGVVLDAGTNAPIVGAGITALFGAQSAHVLSDDAGRFELTGFTETEGELHVTAAGHVGVTIGVFLEPLQILDLGQVRLRSESVADPRPDLLPEHVDAGQAVTDPHSLQLSGSLHAVIANRGTATAHGPIHLLAFHDTDGDGRYSAAIDQALGEAVLNEALGVGETREIEVPVDGQLPFRDAPILLWVDSREVVVESEEGNNVSASSHVCAVQPEVGNFEPVLKWAWDGSGDVMPTYNQVVMTPAVAQMTDDNGDGVINDADVPDVIFVTYPQSAVNAGDAVGILRIISGDTGSEVLSITDPALRVNGFGSIAVADINEDGISEIVAQLPYAYGGGIVAITNTGYLLWKNNSVGTSGHLSGGPSIADIDGDGMPEIVHGNVVVNADGTTKWKGNGYSGVTFFNNSGTVRGPISVVADIDNDGDQEVIAGASVYSSDGELLWKNTNVGDGLTAIGNFNDDLNPELVVVTHGKVWLLDNEGVVIWGPVAIPGGGNGGPPTIADMDGDGVPEIGVAGAYRYAVFKADGSLLWSSAVQDVSSSFTGSSVFDFDGNGRAEVVYSDERYLRVYDGQTGGVLISVRNVSRTGFEYPVIADIDGDGHSNIVVVANWDVQVREFSGVRAFRDINNSWVATRKIWNQHAYSITNINEDGSVPTHPEPSWLTHNTYRLNAFPDRLATAVSDLTAALLRIVDHGTSQPLSLSLRVGNGGAAPSPSGVVVRFFDGDPEAGGAVLGELVLPPIAAGAWLDITLDGIPALTQNQIHAVIDPDGRVTECRRDNNSTAVARSGTPLGSIAVTTDRTSYGPNEPVIIGVTVTNLGSLAHDFGLRLLIETEAGEPVAELAPHVLPLAGGATMTLDDVWSTGLTLAGSYRVRAVLLDADGNPLSDAIAGFAIVADPAGAPVISLRTTADRAVYHSSDTARLDNLIRNTSANLRVPEANLSLRVLAPDGGEVFSAQAALGELLPGGQKLRGFDHAFQAAALGDYRVLATVSDGSGATLASDETHYRVEDDPARALSGSVAVQSESLEAGQSQVCTDTVHNQGTQAYADLPLRRSVVRLDEAELILTQEDRIDLAAGASHVHARGIDTAGWLAGDYACVLEARPQDAWLTLAHAGFRVSLPAVDLDGQLSLGGRGRLLILLDPSTEADDPLGPPTAPSTAVQRAFLEILLRQAGWSYVMVEDAADFAQELHSGAYSLYLLLHETEKLAEQVQSALREAVWRGEGLVVGGRHDARNGRLDPALGIAYRGKHAAADGVWLDHSELHPADQADLLRADKALRSDPAGADVVGRFLFASAPPQNNNGNQSDAAVTHHRYGDGKSAYVGYDLLAEAALADTIDPHDNLHARLLLGALDAVSPEPPPLGAGGVIPLTLRIDNLGAATPGRFRLNLPEGVGLIDALSADSALDAGIERHANGTVTGAFDLAEDASTVFTLWLRLPPEPGPLVLEATLQSGSAPDYRDHAVLGLDLLSAPPPGIDGLIADIQALGNVFNPVKNALQRAANALAAGDHNKALGELLQAADHLERLNRPEATTLRRDLAQLIRHVAARL